MCRCTAKHIFPRRPISGKKAGLQDRNRSPSSRPILEIAVSASCFVLLCTELWFTQWARHYGQEGIDLLLCPRATSQTSVQQWIDCGKVSAIVSGAYCLSSNRSGLGEGGFLWGGAGWVTQPGTGNVLTLTSSDCRFSTIEIDLETSRDAKVNYPLNVLD
jgi:predicted amidohydrolase